MVGEAAEESQPTVEGGVLRGVVAANTWPGRSRCGAPGSLAASGVAGHIVAPTFTA
jgi:hypothetical protein